jgi:hypothetical protein
LINVFKGIENPEILLISNKLMVLYTVIFETEPEVSKPKTGFRIRLNVSTKSTPKNMVKKAKPLIKD